ncbi:hypothetical protein [Rathayibacter toxicus]|uniref:hypothetical protein n=1 Tax=Rathayibacter toxicus TaxID=145458 RepID=UPI001C03C88B|nr:hypothetical protein [Rathayibacter toxicus]
MAAVLWWRGDVDDLLLFFLLKGLDRAAHSSVVPDVDLGRAREFCPEQVLAEPIKGRLILLYRQQVVVADCRDVRSAVSRCF